MVSITDIILFGIVIVLGIGFYGGLIYGLVKFKQWLTPKIKPYFIQLRLPSIKSHIIKGKRKCSNCASWVPADALHCKYCKSPVGIRGIFYTILAVIVALLLAWLFVYVFWTIPLQHEKTEITRMILNITNSLS
ncbi:hypothetical protein HYU06_05835 [Candidatus Woesearchaeota archaeon]|nr:hypothetical protein [Candidatus Woesearchaeota archaeon]